MAFITNTDTTIFPYNDDDMKYDIDRRQYVLTVNGFENWSGLSLSNYTDSPEEATAFLYEISDDIYEFIYSMYNLRMVDYKRYKIAKDGNIRADFKKALMTHCRYGLRSGANLLKDQHGVNIEKGKAIDLNSIRGLVGISSQSQSILNRLGLLFVGFLHQVSIDDDGTY